MAVHCPVNPMQTTNARGTFYAKSDGLIRKGVALDDRRHVMRWHRTLAGSKTLCGADFAG